MIALRVSREVLEAAALSVGVKADIDSYSATRHRVKLYPIVSPENWQVDATRTRLLRTRVVPTGGTRGDAAPSYKWANYRRWRDSRGDSKYQRESVGYGTAGRRVHAVCWHGFRDYFRKVYASTPDARFRTSIDTWRGAADFEARFQESGYRNIGPPIAPVQMVDACR